MGYIVAFNRDRDSYQVPLALAERWLLDRFVTDYYAGVSRIRVPRLDHRSVEGVPVSNVTSVPSAMMLQAAWKAYRSVNRRSPFLPCLSRP